MSFVRPRAVRDVVMLCALAAIGATAGCSGSRELDDRESSGQAVEGLVTVRGNEPFTALMLVTDDRNVYILITNDESSRSEMRRVAPGRFLVSGVLYADYWQGRKYAHLRVEAWQRIQG